MADVMTKQFSVAARCLILSGADNVRVRAPQLSLADLKDALELAVKTGMPTCSKTLILTIEREIRKKERQANRQVKHG